MELGKEARALEALSALPPPWDMTRVREICSKAIRKKLHLFEAWRGQIGRDDLMQLCLRRAQLIHAKFDPVHGGSKYVTWITRAANFALIDEHRRLSRKAKGEAEWREDQERAIAKHGSGRQASAPLLDWLAAAEGVGLPGGLGGDDETLAERVARVYVQALRTFPPKRHKNDPSTTNVATAVAASMLMTWRKLSCHGVRFLLAQDADLRGAMRLKNLPSHMWFSRARSFVKDNLGIDLGE